MDMLYSLKERYKCYFIKGNKEDYWINYEANGEKGWNEFDSTTGSLYYTYHNLRSRDLEFFKSLSNKEELEFEGLIPITICHGSPKRNNDKIILNSEKSFSIIENNINPYILCGHTHIQGAIEHNGRVVLNPGAVGVPLNSKGKAQFMILQGKKGAWDYKFISLDYNIEKVITDLYCSGLAEKAPFWCEVTENLLKTGEISHGTVLSKAMTLCVNKYGKCNWPEVPDECWEQAIKQVIKK